MGINPNLSENAVRDMKLIVSACAGINTAYAKLMKHYKHAIYYMILKMVNNKADAEDLTIETFGKAFARLGQYEPGFAFSTWLFRIASNTAIDHLRKNKVPTVPLEITVGSSLTISSEYNYNLISENDTPEETLIKEQNAILLHKAVSNLKPKLQVLIKLRYFKEYSYAEIADELNLPVGTIKVQLSRSRDMLYNMLKNTEMRQ